jgi:hypothetical protein
VNLTKWAHLLNATGGALNPSKCYWYMIAHKYHEGQWVYDDKPPLGNLKIPLPDRPEVEIARLPVMEARKMLGVWSSPDGNDTTQLHEVVIKKAKKWVQRLKNAHLPTHLAWKAYHYQLWPGIRYGLATLANNKAALNLLLHKLEFEMLSFLGVNRHVKTE